MSDLEPIQLSRLSEIGQILGKARQEKGLTLEEVSGKTLIRAAILKAIEEGDARPLPEPVYIRGFIRRFGDLVGLNGMELCDSFPWQPSGSVPLSFVSAGAVAAESQVGSQASPAVVEAESEGLGAAENRTETGDAYPNSAQLDRSLEEVEAERGSTVACETAEVQDSLLGEVTEAAGFPEANSSALAADNVSAAEGLPGGNASGLETPGEALGDLPLTAPSEVNFGAEPEAAKTAAFGDAVSTSDALTQDAVTQDESTRDALPQGQDVWAETNHSNQPNTSPDRTSPDHESAYESRAALFGDEAELSDDNAVVSAGTGTASAGAVAAGAMAANSVGVVDSVRQATSDGAEAAAPSPSLSSAGGVATLPAPPAPVTYREPEQRSPLPWILAAVAAVVGLGVVALAFTGGNRQGDPALVSEPEPVEQVVGTGSSDAASTAPGAESEAATEAATEPVAESTPPPATVPADKVVLELEVKGTEDAWMDVLVDGELALEGNQVPGFKQRWEGKQTIELATARPDMVWVSVNGQQAQPFGQFAEAKPVKIDIFKPANAQ